MASIKSRKHAQPTSPSTASLTTATLLTGLALGSPFTALGQAPQVDSAAGERAGPVDELFVYGQRGMRYSSDTLASPKFTEPLLDVTQTVAVIGSDLFEEQGATSLTDALRNSPGVGTFFVGENGSTNTGDAVYMRGFDSSSSIFVDGVRDLGSITRDVFNVERVEVAKGPAGTDNGRSAPTGAIDMVSKQPFREDASRLSLSSAGAGGQRRLTADVNRHLGGDAAVRLNLMTQDGGVPGRDEVERRRWGIAPSLALGLGGSTRVYLDLLHVDQDNVPDGGVPTIGLPGYLTPDPARPQIAAAPPVDSENFYGTTSDYDDVAADMFTLRVDHDFAGGVRLRNTLRWGRNHQDYMLTSFTASQDPARFSTPDPDDPSTWTLARALPNFKDQTDEILTSQTNVTASLGAGGVRHDFSAGAEVTRERLYTVGLDDSSGTARPPADLYHPDAQVSGLEWGPNGESGRGRTDTLAAYAFDTAKLDERWQVNGGVRLDRYTTDYASLAVCGGRRGPDCGGLPTGSIVPGVDARITDTLFNWKLGALFKPAPNGSVYVDHATSQQPPGGSSLELSSRPNSADNPAFAPQKAETSEIGTKWSLLDGSLLLTAALYDTSVSNEIVQDPVDQQYYQSGSKRVRGIELNAVGRITDAWSLAAGFTTMDAVVEEGPTVAQDGSRSLAYTPDAAFTAWSTYAFPRGLTVGGGVRYAGAMRRGTDGAPGTPEFTESYTVWDAVIGYAVGDHLDLRLNVDNLLDEVYVAAINKSGYRYMPGPPRSFLLTANIRF